MADVDTPASNDRVNLVYETKVGDKAVEVELPFKLMVLADFTRDERSEYFEDQQPIKLDAEGHDVAVVFRKLQPELKIKTTNCLQGDDSELLIELKFENLQDFSPRHILQQVSWLQKIQQFCDALLRASEGSDLELRDEDKTFIESVLKNEGVTLEELQANRQGLGWLVSSLEQRLCEQLDEILHHAEFAAMESSWRALGFLVERTDFSENCEIAVINISKQGLADDFEDAAEVSQSYYYQLLYSDEYGQYGGRPYGAVIADFEFDPTAPDMRLLQRLASVSAVAHAPFIAAAGAEFFSINSFSEFSRLRDLASIFSQPAYVKWSSFRESEDSRYVGLTLPRFLLREAWQTEIDSLQYEEKVRDKDKQLLWGNAAFAFATRLLDSFANYRWCLNCTGESSGKVDGLKMERGKIPTQFILTDRRESDVVEQGFIPFSVHKGDDTAAFYSAYSSRRIGDSLEQDSDLSERLAAQIPYLLIVSRISQYLKIMQRENIGSWNNRREIDQQLNKWLSRYVSDMDNPAPGVRARRPLRRAEIKVREVEGKQDWFLTQVQITPHLKFMGNSFHLTEISKMEKN